jgi:alpha/beta superfamily hydrolase
MAVADVRAQVAVSIITEFEDFRIFKPASYQEKLVNNMLDQVISWGRALKLVRNQK